MAIKTAPAKLDWPRIRRQRRARRSFWSVRDGGSAAAAAIAAADITSQTTPVANAAACACLMNELAHAIALVPPRPTEAEAETQRLAAEREQLSARVANLKRNLDDVIGSITQQISLAVLLRPANQP